MRQIQLDSFVDIVEKGDNQLIESFLLVSDTGYDFKNDRGMDIKEIYAFYNLVKKFVDSLTASQKSGYILGFKVEKGIREEFDVLRCSVHKILNIELKTRMPEMGEKKIRNQLLRHKYLLGVLNKEVKVFSYVESEDKIYTLDQDENLIETDVATLLSQIPDDYINGNLLKELNLNNILISPYSEPDEFNKRKYFLTDEQMEKRNKILGSNKQNICLTGGPGSGKSLLLVDLANKYKEMGKKVAIVFCSKMEYDEAKRISEQIGVDVIPIKIVMKDENILKEYEILLADEAQRLREGSFEKLLSFSDKKIIFSLDQQQTLHPKEEEFNVHNRLLETGELDVFELKNIIRTDKAMSSFIQKLLNLRAEKVQPYEFDNVQIVYFDNETDAIEYIDFMSREKNFVSIEQTEYKSKMDNKMTKEKVYHGSLGTHDVIGREYDNVLVVMDEGFEHDEEGRLRYRNLSGYYPYLGDHQMFQSLTRVRKELIIVVLKNPELYHTIQNIINWKNKKLYGKHQNAKVKSNS